MATPKMTIASKFARLLSSRGTQLPPKPVTLLRKHLPFLLRDQRNHREQYMVCDKTDGLTAVVFVDESGVTHVHIPEKNEWDSRASAGLEFAGTVLLGEIILDTLVVLYDCVVFCGRRMDCEPLPQRLEAMNLFVSACDKLTGERWFTIKSFFHGGGNVRRAAEQAFDDDGFDFPRDGLIFAPVDPSKGPVFKWKPRNTIDFNFLYDGGYPSVVDDFGTYVVFEPRGKLSSIKGSTYANAKECMWDPFARTWVVLRSRATACVNSVRVARRIWDSIVNPVTQAMLCGTEDVPPTVHEAHRCVKRDLYRRVAGLVRPDPGLASKALTLAELMCGAAADRHAWRSAGFDVVVGVDADAACVGAAKANATSDTVVEMFEVRDAVRHSDTLASDLGAGRFDAVSVQFAVHFAFDNKKASRRFLRAVAALLRPGGVFFGTFMDGARARNHLFFEKMRTFKVPDLYDGGWHLTATQDGKTRRVDVTRPGVGTCAEPFVDATTLVSRAARAGLELVDLTPFSCATAGSGAAFSDLNSAFVFRKKEGAPKPQDPKPQDPVRKAVWEAVRGGRRLPLPLREGSAAALVGLQAEYAAARRQLLRTVALSSSAPTDFAASAAASRACVRCGCGKRFDADGDRVCFCATCPAECTDWVAVPSFVESETVAAYLRYRHAPPSMVFAPTRGSLVRARLVDCVGGFSISAALEGGRFCLLPLDVSLRIFALLDPPDVGNAMLTCTEWCDTIRRGDARKTDNETLAWRREKDDLWSMSFFHGPSDDVSDASSDISGVQSDFSYCLTGDTLVRMASGQDVPLAQIRKGDRVSVLGGGEAVVACTTVSAARVDTWRAAPGCPRGTYRHPIIIIQRGGPQWWTSPHREAEKGGDGVVYSGKEVVYNLLFEADAPSHAYYADGCMTVALGHGSSEPAIAHPVYGCHAVIAERLRARDPLGFSAGLVCV